MRNGAYHQNRVEDWFESKGWRPFPFQTEAWSACIDRKQGLVNAPTGSGKTYSLLVPIVLEFLNNPGSKGLQAIWITPIRALAKEIELSTNRLVNELGIEFEVGLRTGDTTQKERDRLKKSAPNLLITTPESLHLMLASKSYAAVFSELKVVVADEWHELVGSKRGVQLELALSRLRGLNPKLRTWGISATIGNLDEAMDVLLGQVETPGVLIRSGVRKKIRMQTILPENIEHYPWAEHLGIRLLKQVIPLIKTNSSTLVFTNTRAQAEIWYQRILEEAPELAGLIAMHHGSISKDLRFWVEDALHEGKLKAVICTSSLDLGVDFRPVDTVIQIGGPKGIARFVQRAGRSGHQPGASSTIYFVPTHALELIEAAALSTAIEQGIVESRTPYIRSFDVLVQYLVTLAVSDGFDPSEIRREVSQTYSYQSISDEEWNWVLRFITSGGESLEAYADFHRVEVENGRMVVKSRKLAMQHRLSIGTIVSDSMILVKYASGGRIGHIEEWFISRLNPGDVFWFAGRCLEVVRLKDMEVQVRRSTKTKAIVPSWQGGRMPLSSEMSSMLRKKLNDVLSDEILQPELLAIRPVVQLQAQLSMVPDESSFLIEQFQTDDGFHAFFFPFEGRLVHEGMASLLAYRMSLLKPISFSIAVNDYGFELLADQPVPVDAAIDNDLFTTGHLMNDIQASVNSTEMAGRRFRDIAAISGLVFKGYPGKPVKDRHLQSSSRLFFEVFSDYDAENLLLRQAYDEVLDFQLEFSRLRNALERMKSQRFVLTYPQHPTPFSFPIMVDRLREKLSSESLEDRVRKMTATYLDR